MGFCEVLTIIFLLLKVFHVISWSWWLVFAPMLIEAAVILFFIAIWLLGVIAAIFTR